MNHRLDLDRRKAACAVALQAVLDPAEVHPMLMRLDDVLDGAGAAAESELSMRLAAALRQEHPLMSTGAQQRFVDQFIQALRIDAGHGGPFGSALWRGCEERPLQRWQWLEIHDFRLHWQASWHGRLLHRFRQLLKNTDRGLGRYMARRYGHTS
jgi:hypothetical protein